jgi:hypothetical protein
MKSHRWFKQFGPSDESYINDDLLIDMMLKEQTHVYIGGAGSCAGCGEKTALRMLCSATTARYGDRWGLIAVTGCNTVIRPRTITQSVPGPLVELALRERASLRHGRPPALGPDGMARQTIVVHRQR